MKAMFYFFILLVCCKNVFAADAEAVWQKGNDLIKQAQGQGKLKDILSPVICGSLQDSAVYIIFNDKTTSQSRWAYLNAPEGLLPIERDLLKFEMISPVQTVENFDVYNIKLEVGNIELVCTQQASAKK